MNLTNLQSLVIPEGAVKSIQLNGSPLWTRPMIYGVSWDKSDTPAMTRTDDAASFGSVTLGRGTTAGSSPFDTLYPWSEMKKVTEGNNTLVSIPKFYFRWTNANGKITLQIADKKYPGFYVSPMHADRGDGKGERDVAYVGRYKSNATTYYSKSGVLPQTTITRATARSKIAALGTGYYQQDYAAYWTVRMLFLVEFANWDGIASIQKSSAPATISDIYTGRTDSMTYCTGISADNMAIQYRWIEDPWCTCLEWIDGIYFSGGNVYIITNPTKFSDTANGTSIGTKYTTEGYVKDWAIPSSSGLTWALWPSSTTGNMTKGYVGDYYYPQTGTVLYSGGSRSVSDVHGPFMLYCDFTASSTSSFVCSRMMKLP